ncbi:tetratricopeptide repeat-containing sulfotransferase family protein [Lacimicrobium alkaliphilum]|uniref:Sulfotransferase n=1 Tax=Lacimicrobium alkaliphilum TaxID=1526571 RepID=A0ABQ1R451_9ALTE|nr:sulfotransferase [Lacimicrobium alkaliphilum]GGD57537.1 sulfotransferase [Lacimicrobium alkaliphilum]
MNEKIAKAQQAFQKKKFKQALSIIEKVNKSKSKQSFLSLQLQAASLVSLKMNVRAKEFFLKALPLAPDGEKKARTYFDLFASSMLLKQYTQSRQYLEKAISLVPPDKSVMWRLSLANLYYQIREYELCEELCARLLVYKPCTLKCMHILMDIAIAQTNTEKVNFYLRQFEGRMYELSSQEILGVYARVEAFTTLDFSRSIDKAIARGADPCTVKVIQGSKLFKEGKDDKSFALLTSFSPEQLKDENPKKRYFEILGKIYDRRKEYRKAFENFTQMNAIAAKQYKLKGGKSEELYEYGKFSSFKLSSEPYTPPVRMFFLVGFPRSGTTLLENVLDSQEKIIALPERPMLDDIKMKMIFDGYNYPKDLHDISDGYLNDLRSRYFSSVMKNCRYESLNQFDVLIDKNPLNQIRLPLIKKLFPDAKIILALRHPLDCILSCYMQHFDVNQHMADFSDWKSSFERYKDTFDLYDGFREYLEWDEYQIRYEDLVNDFESQVESVLKFIGIDAEKDSYMNFNRRAQSGVITTPSGSQVRQGIYKTATQRWLNYKEYIAPHIDIVRPYIEKYGYTCDI